MLRFVQSPQSIDGDGLKLAVGDMLSTWRKWKFVTYYLLWRLKYVYYVEIKQHQEWDIFLVIIQRLFGA